MIAGGATGTFTVMAVKPPYNSLAMRRNDIVRQPIQNLQCVESCGNGNQPGNAAFSRFVSPLPTVLTQLFNAY